MLQNSPLYAKAAWFKDSEGNILALVQDDS